jgi:hypothetical protein
MAAEEFEMLLDVYERSKNPDVLKQCVAYYDGFTSPQRYGTDWLTLNPAGKYNDDMIWITIATLRMHSSQARNNYIKLHQKKHSTAFGCEVGRKLAAESTGQQTTTAKTPA